MLKNALRSGAGAVAPFMWSRFLSDSGFTWPNEKKFGVTFSFNLEVDDDVEALPWLADAFSAHDYPCSIACTGRLVEAKPREHAKLTDEGHEAVNHSYSHPELLNKLSERQIEEEITKCESVLERELGVKPIGFRCPNFGLANSNAIYRVLEERGYSYSSSTNCINTPNHGMPYHPAGSDFLAQGKMKVLELPLMACPAHYYPLFDDWHCFRGKAHEGDFVEVFKQALAMGEEHGLLLNFYFHPRFFGAQLTKALDALSESKAWVGTLEQAAGLF